MCRIVQNFLPTIADDTQRLVCFLMMRNYDDRDICRELHIGRKTLDGIKLQIAIGLRQAGIRIGDGEC